MTTPDTLRVRGLRVEAIRIAAKRCFDVELTVIEADRLAAAGTIAQACDHVEADMVRRRAAESTVPNDRSRAFVDREVEIPRAAVADVVVRHDVEAELKRLDRSEPRLHDFVRATARLYVQQRAILSEAIVDPARCAAAILRLDGVYARHVEMAEAHVTPGGATLA